MMGLLAGVAVVAALAVGWWRSHLRPGAYLAWRVLVLYTRLWHGCRFTPPNPVPATGPVLLVANHTSSPDSAFLAAACGRPLSYVVANAYYGLPLAGRLFRALRCVPVCRDGRDAGAV